MKKTTSIYLLLPLIASLLFLSCKKDKDDEPSSSYTYSTSLSSALVTNFALKADTTVMTSLDSVFFTIDADRGLIYNADSLPMGTRIDSLKVTMSFSSGVGTAVFKVLDAQNNTTDVEYSTSSSEAIDFRYGVKLVVTSYDGTKVRNYDVKVNVHAQEPDSISWPMSARRNLPAAADDNYAQGTARLGDTYVNVIHNNAGYFVSRASKLAGPWDSKAVNWGFEPNPASLMTAGEKLYVLDVNGNLYESADADTWVATGEQWSHILGAYQGRVMGITAEPYRIDEYPRRASFSLVEAPAGFPVKGTSQMLLVSNDWSVAPQGVLVGGVDAQGKTSSAVWAYDGTRWAKMGNSDGTLPALDSPTMFSYVTYPKVSKSSLKTSKVTTWMVMGGKLADGTFNRTTYLSTNQGITWTKAGNSLSIPEAIPSFYGAQAFVENTTMKSSQARRRVAQAVNEWECPYIYLIGGYGSNGQLLNNVWCGVLNRAAQKPLY